MRIALAGSGKLGVEMLKALLGSRHEVVALIQNGRRTKGYRRKVFAMVTRAIATRSSTIGMVQRHDIPIIWIDKMTEEELAPLRGLEPDLLLVGGFGIILKAPLLNLPRLGCVNAHSALLPRHRGPNPFMAVILAGEKETGVTFHTMDEGIDTGEIIAQYSVDIKPTDTAGSVYAATSRMAGKHVLEVMERVEREGVRGVPQDPALATYDKNVQPGEAWLRWDRPAEEIDRLVRACSPNMLARFRQNGWTVYVFAGRYDATPVDAVPGTVLEAQPVVKVATGLGSYTILQAYRVLPLPWFWPGRWSRPAPGDILE